DAAAGRVVDDDVALGADQIVDPAVDVGVAGGLVVASPRVHGDDTGAGVVAAIDVVRDFLRLGGQSRVLPLAGHATGRGDGHDHLARFHLKPSCPPIAGRILR